MGEQRMTISLNGSDLTVTQVVAAARHGETVALAPEAIAAMRLSRAVVQDVVAGGEPVYGLTTGVGERKAYLLDPAQRQRFNHRLVLNHRIAQGDAAPADVVRGAMLCLANSYAKGVTGVRPELAEMIVTLLNEGFAPPVRRLGSIGQGDLGPMADLAHGRLTRSGLVAAGRGQVPAGPADLPLPAADPRRGQGRARLHPEHPPDRAQLLAVQPGRGGARRKRARK